jgi:hypothetical protein
LPTIGVSDQDGRGMENQNGRDMENHGKIMGKLKSPNC